jgi:hypothetical protein
MAQERQSITLVLGDFMVDQEIFELAGRGTAKGLDSISRAAVPYG